MVQLFQTTAQRVIMLACCHPTLTFYPSWCPNFLLDPARFNVQSRRSLQSCHSPLLPLVSTNIVHYLHQQKPCALRQHSVRAPSTLLWVHCYLLHTMHLHSSIPLTCHIIVTLTLPRHVN